MNLAEEKALKDAIARHFPNGPRPERWADKKLTGGPAEPSCEFCGEVLHRALAPFGRHLLCGQPLTPEGEKTVMHRGKKETWEATLPPWRNGAVGRYTDGEVFLVTVLRNEPDRCVRIHLRSDHARALAADLVNAAEKADTPRREVA